MEHILRCTSCKSYTMQATCSCGGKAVTTKPPKYSPEDKYQEYRIKAKRPQLEKEGLI